MMRRTITLMAGGLLLAALLGAGVPAAAQGKKVVVAIPGIPSRKSRAFSKNMAWMSRSVRLTTAPQPRVQS